MFRRVLICVFLVVLKLCLTEKITYISVEHPAVTYINYKYLPFLNLTAWRYGRRSPVYYVGLHFNVNFVFGNNVTADFYFYEFLSNQYKRSFVEMHFKWCNLIHKDVFFGAAMKQGKLAGPCPYQPGDYHLSNMTIPPEVIPRGFPLTKGRIYCNITLVTASRQERLACLHIDMELKQLNVKNKGFDKF